MNIDKNKFKSRKVRKTSPEGCKTNILQLLFDNFLTLLSSLYRYYRPRFFFKILENWAIVYTKQAERRKEMPFRNWYMSYRLNDIMEIRCIKCNRSKQEFLYFVIIKFHLFFPYFNLFMLIFIQCYVNSNYHVSILYL
jgi:hypothetical protein